MTYYLVAFAVLGWSLFLIQRYGTAPKMPDLFAPVSDDERRAREELVAVRSERDDLRIRAKHADRERDIAKRDCKEATDALAHERRRIWMAKRVLDGPLCPKTEPVGVE